MRIAVIGGGVNGIFSAWCLSKSGHSVDLFEAKKLMSQTSSNSSKLLHGGIRYLEHCHIGLVREALVDRAWWMENAPKITRPIEIAMPVYKTSKRGLFTLYIGALIYRLLAGKFSLGKSRLFNSKKSAANFSELKTKNLSGIVTFFDGQMNEEGLGCWLVNQARVAGVQVHENKLISSFDTSGRILIDSDCEKRYDIVVNAAGPWAADLNKKNRISTDFSLELVRGSHLLIDHSLQNSYLFQDPDSERVVYVLDYFGKSLIGTTEVLQKTAEIPVCSDEERKFLIQIFNQHFKHQISEKNILKEYSGLRPILCKNKNLSATNYSKASRESKLEVTGRLITIYGGKWTTAPSLAKKLKKKINEVRF
jgi:glycerol-3-phosphate dehydrogenase